MGKEAGAGRPTEPLEPAVKAPKNSEKAQGSRKAEENVPYAGRDQPDAHEVPGIYPISEHSARKLADPVRQSKNACQKAELPFVIAQILHNGGGGKGKTETSQVVEGVPDVHRVEDSEAPLGIRRCDDALVCYLGRR